MIQALSPLRELTILQRRDGSLCHDVQPLPCSLGEVRALTPSSGAAIGSSERVPDKAHHK